jgi:transcriptional regulator GlxA family with amidase domain
MQIVFLLYHGMTALDLVGPHEILCRLPGAKIQRAAERPGLIHTDSGLMLNVEHALSDISHADILVIPGAGNATTLRKTPKTLDWIRSIHATTIWTTSVCTGSLILGAAGILSGLRATTHWAAFDRLEYWGAQPTNGRIVEDGRVITAAGVSAGIDMALNLAIKVAGAQFTQTIHLGIEYDPEPPFDMGSFGKANSNIRNALQVRMAAAFESK